MLKGIFLDAAGTLIRLTKSVGAHYSLVASLLMTVGQMSFFDASEILAQDRNQQILELAVASPTAYALPLIARILVLTSMGIAGFAESWLMARFLFGIHMTIFHPGIFAITLIFTVLAGAATALITTAVFCLTRTTRTYQNAISGPLYLLSGALVPVSFLPAVLRPLSRLLYLFWSADLLRESMQPADPVSILPRLAAILILGGAIALDRYRVARAHELSAALSVSRNLTEELTQKGNELGKAHRALALAVRIARLEGLAVGRGRGAGKQERSEES